MRVLKKITGSLLLALICFGFLVVAAEAAPPAAGDGGSPPAYSDSGPLSVPRTDGTAGAGGGGAGGDAGGGAGGDGGEVSDTVETVPPGSTVLPNTKLKVFQCKILMNQVNQDPSAAKAAVATRETFKEASYLDILACGIKTGDIRLWMIAYYIRFMLEFIIGLSGLIAVGGIIYGGYLYLFAGISEDKDKGKKAIMYSVGGMVLTLVAWAIVNIAISFVTI